MPTYEYKCTDCEHRFETIQRITDDPLQNCPECNMDTLGKVLTSCNFVLKGLKWPGKNFFTEQKKIAKEQTARDDKRDLVEYEQRWGEKTNRLNTND